jgi:serine protease Do
VLDARGHILTNSHVVKDAARVTIVLADGRKFPGKVVGYDTHTDIGVAQFEKDPPKLTAARLGDSDAIRVGQWVLAVGSPLGLDETVTAGIVSGVGRASGRMSLSGERVRRYITTDALINPGNSGGPLVNLSGEVIGIATMINVGPGGSYGFAIPIAQAANVAQALVKDGRLHYAYLGVYLQDAEGLTEQERAQLPKGFPTTGAVVARVSPDSPADKAGLKTGDVILRVAAQPVTVAADVVDAVSQRKPGDKLELEYQRAGDKRKATVALTELPAEPGAGQSPAIGASLQTLTESMARSLGIDPRLKGAVVTDVSAGSPAAKAGLQPGDVIREVDRKTITSADDAAAALRTGGPKGHLLRVTSAAGTRFVTVPGE